MIVMPCRSLLQPPALWLILALALTAGCAQLPQFKTSAASLTESAASSAAQGDHAQAGELYLQAAAATGEPERSQLYLQAARAYVNAENREAAQRALDTVDPAQLDARGEAELQLVQVRARILGRSPAEALRMLPPPGGGAPPDIAARIWALRADLLFADDRIVEGVHALVQRDVWLLDPERAKANDYRIWTTLGEHPEVHDQRRALANTDDTTRGWVTLAEIARQVWPDRQSLENELARWEQRHPGHPAGRHILPERFDYTPSVAAMDGRGTNVIGLALPLTGDFAGPAEAVHDGFMAAYYASDKPRPRLRIYDTAAMPDMARILDNARSDGVGLLVGPLSKARVTELGNIPNPGMPILALNYTETGERFPGFYQFGLSPEDEARAVARRALQQGMHRAIALIPEGDWGARMLDAFRQALQDGGELVDYATYNPDKQDHAEPIKQVLAYGQGQSAEALEAAQEGARATGENRESRKNVDFLFLAAQPGQARLIRAQLRFYHATRLPVLATSHVFTGDIDPGRDSDLNDILFADIPWLLAERPEIQDRRRRLSEIWPDTIGRYPRLFAMGYDAWLLVQRMRETGMTSGELLSGNTGELYLESDGQIRRRLVWGRFVKGRPQPVESPPKRYELSY